MKKLIFYSLLIISTLLTFSHTLANQADTKKNTGEPPVLKALLIIVDEYSDPANNMISASVKRDYGTVSKLLEVLDSRNIVKLEKEVLMGKSTDMKTVTNAINNMQCGPNDILFFYFSGHGGMRDGKNTILFLRNGEELSRDKLESMFKAKNAKFKIIISDACSNPVDGVKASRSFASTIRATDGQYDAIYKKLFTQNTGLLSLSASSPNEYAWSDDELGGYFTHYFINEGLLKNPVENWNDLFRTAKDKTMQMFARMPESQKSQLAKEGINSQTPKAYSMPGQGNPNPNPTNNQVVSVVNPPNNISTRKATIVNQSGTNVTCYIDMNEDAENWDENKLKEFKLGVNQQKNIDIPSTFCLLNEEELYYYDIEDDGTYYIEKNNTGELELYDQANIADNEEESGEMNQILAGKWKWEDTEGETMFVVNQNGKYHFEDEGVSTEDGQWEYTVIEEEGEKYDVLITSFTDENGKDNQYAYLVNYFDDESLQLILFSAVENGQELNIDDMEENDLVVMLYKIN